MKKNCKTRISMEEQYAMISIPYKNMEDKQIILKANDETILVFQESPDVYIKPFEPGKGKVVIEFRFNNRLVGDYFNYLITQICADGLELEIE